jgi:hypothetical protein
MSTPASAVLNGNAGAANSTTAPGGSSVPGGAPTQGGGTAGPGTTSFFSTWDKPEQKDVKDWVANKNYADPFVLAKSARELESNLNTLRTQASLKSYPADKIDPTTGAVTPADANARKAWNLTMGVPETADKYDIPLPADNPYPEFKTMMADEFHKAGVPGAMATVLAKGYESALVKMEELLKDRENAQSQAALLELERDWGGNFKERVALAARGKEWLSKEVGGLSDMQMRTMETVLGTAKFMSAMWKIGAGNGEARFAGGDGKPATFGNSAQAAQAELDMIMADRSGGKISDFQWREKASKRVEELRDIIVAGMGTMQ